MKLKSEIYTMEVARDELELILESLTEYRNRLVPNTIPSAQLSDIRSVIQATLGEEFTP